MKKRFIFSLVGIVCAFCFALTIAACNEEENDKVACKLETTPAHVKQVQVSIGNSIAADLGAVFDRWFTPRQIDKGQEYTITVYLDDDYALGSLKMFVNDTQTELSDYVDSNTNEVVSGIYTAKYTPNADFTIKFSGEAEAQPAIMTAGEWQTCLTQFANAKNFSLQMSVGTTVVGAMKLDGYKYYEVVDTSERLLDYVQDSDEYFYYGKTTTDLKWDKYSSYQYEYNHFVNTNACDLVEGAASSIGANYSTFSYSNGKYTAETFQVTADFTLKDVEITVADKNITGVVCTYVGTGATPDRLVTIDSVGSTQITIPSDEEIENNYVCPIKKDEIIYLPVGTTVSKFYEMYPDLISDAGKWKLFKYDSENKWFISVENSYVFKEVGELRYMLSFQNVQNIGSVEFTIVVTDNAE